MCGISSFSWLVWVVVLVLFWVEKMKKFLIFCGCCGCEMLCINSVFSLVVNRLLCVVLSEVNDNLVVVMVVGW